MTSATSATSASRPKVTSVVFANFALNHPVDEDHAVKDHRQPSADVAARQATQLCRPVENGHLQHH